MKRESAGGVALLLGAFVLALGLWSSYWLTGDELGNTSGLLGAATHGLGRFLGRATFSVGLGAAVLALPMTITGARALCAVGIALAGATLLGAIGYLLEPVGLGVGPGAIAGIIGALLVLAGAMLVMQPAVPRVEPPPSDGRRLVYDADGKLVRIEQWAGGSLQSTRAVGRDGLVMDEPPKP